MINGVKRKKKDFGKTSTEKQYCIVPKCDEHCILLMKLGFEEDLQVTLNWVKLETQIF